MKPTELTNLLQLAESTALWAGRHLKSKQSDWAKIVFAQDRDVKVKADKLAEEIILAQLKAATDFPILTEETGWHGEKSKWTWIVDPLDGSFNYSHHIPFCCVAIALVKDGEPRIGVVYDFNHDELFSGIVGVGSWLNHQSIKVSDTDVNKNAVLNTGFPARSNYSAEALQAFAQHMGQWRKVRMLGSAALALAYVAAGRADAYQEQGTMFWDVAAGAALVTAAGGKVQLEGDIFKGPLSARASNGALQH
jgi:myo-inositol-1(or 4)-monophosphatase